MKSIELTFDENRVGDGVTAISLVERPAIKVNWMAFSEEGTESKKVHFAIADEEQQMIAGPVMIPNMDIPRVDPQTGEKFTVFYEASTIQKMNEHFIKTGKQTSTTIEHQMTLNGVSVVETWIIADSNNDKANHYGFNLPAGTWFVVMKVDDPKVWNAVKEGVVKGFSLEGYFGEEKKSEFNESIISMLKTNIKEAFRQVFAASEEKKEEENKQEFASLTVTDTEGNAVELNFAGDALEVGTEVRIMNPEGEEVVVPDGVYALEDGRVVTVADSVVTEVAEVVVEDEAENMSKETSEDQATFSSEEFENKMLNVFEKFGDMIDKKIEDKFAQSQNELKTLRSELSEIPGADAIADSPKDSGEKKAWKSWKEFTKEQKNNK